MPVSYPIAMPFEAASTQYFEPERVDLQTQRVDGRVNGVTLGLPLWHGRWAAGGGRAKGDQWRAFIGLLRGSQMPFYGYDNARPFPLSCPNGFVGMTRPGGGAFDGSATSWSISEDHQDVGLTGQPAGLVLGLGDYGMLRWQTGGSERRSLHRVLVGGVANGSGVMSVMVEPPVPSLVPGGAVWDLNRPHCVMKLKPETKMGEMSRAKRLDGSILAIQDLRP